MQMARMLAGETNKQKNKKKGGKNKNLMHNIKRRQSI